MIIAEPFLNGFLKVGDVRSACRMTRPSHAAAAVSRQRTCSHSVGCVAGRLTAMALQPLDATPSPATTPSVPAFQKFKGPGTQYSPSQLRKRPFSGGRQMVLGEQLTS